jgi:hypothetical protein
MATLEIPLQGADGALLQVIVRWHTALRGWLDRQVQILLNVLLRNRHVVPGEYRD